MKTTSLFSSLLALAVAGAVAAGGAWATAQPGGHPEVRAALDAQPGTAIAAAVRRTAVADPDLDGEVTSAEAVRYYETRFRLIDANRDGWIHGPEFLQTVIVRSMHALDSIAPPRPQPLGFHSVDLDGDGALTPEEFLRALLMRRKPAGAGRAGSPRQTIFEMVDADQDGALSKQEFMAAGAEDFSRSDADGDGKVTIWEFYGGTSL